MKQAEIKELAARLEQAHTLSNSQVIQLRKDLERFAARDLYGAAHLCRDHLNKAADLRLPAVIQAAPLLAKHFEARMHEQRRAIDLHHEQDKQLRQPEPHREYVGPIVGTTPQCVIQMDKETGDLIVHPRGNLVVAFEPADKDNNLSIQYPQAAIGGVGLVTRVPEHQPLQAGYSMALENSHSKQEHSMEHAR